jgi:CBS domain-containing protein
VGPTPPDPTVDAPPPEADVVALELASAAPASEQPIASAAANKPSQAFRMGFMFARLHGAAEPKSAGPLPAAVRSKTMTQRTKPKKVKDFMSRQLITLRESDRISQAAREMSIASIRHMPVVDEHGRLKGIVSTHDLMAALGQRGDLELREIMTGHVITVTTDTPADEAVGTLIDRKVNALPVVDRAGDLVGIITATDFLVVAHQALTGTAIERETGEL